MIRLFYFIFSLIFLVGCGVNERKETKAAPQEKQLDSAELAAREEAMREAAEQARIDSITQTHLEADSLKEKHILVDKETCTLYVREDGNTLFSVPVCLGSGIGQKMRRGDHKTPEGEYKIHSIENASGYTHDFHDGLGKRRAYGNWFFRLNTPQSTHIGIHGTCFPESVGKRESDGCVRLHNDDLDSLRQYVSMNMKVIILPDIVTD